MNLSIQKVANPYLILGAGAFLASLLFGWYLFQLQGLTETAYRVSVLEAHAQELQRSLSTMRSVSGASSTASLEGLAGQLGFERAKTIQYIRILEPAVAQNR
ncbi:MAG: hypothetical protein Q8Q38_00180 [bacterium]|nr:hypothetical protein [bacterium]